MKKYKLFIIFLGLFTYNKTISIGKSPYEVQYLIKKKEKNIKLTENEMWYAQQTIKVYIYLLQSFKHIYSHEKIKNIISIVDNIIPFIKKYEEVIHTDFMQIFSIICEFNKTPYFKSSHLQLNEIPIVDIRKKDIKIRQNIDRLYKKCKIKFINIENSRIKNLYKARVVMEEKKLYELSIEIIKRKIQKYERYIDKLKEEIEESSLIKSRDSRIINEMNLELQRANMLERVRIKNILFKYQCEKFEIHVDFFHKNIKLCIPSEEIDAKIDKIIEISEWIEDIAMEEDNQEQNPLNEDSMHSLIDVLNEARELDNKMQTSLDKYKEEILHLQQESTRQFLGGIVIKATRSGREF
jgi:hypothetical protein